ncbi:NADPH-dependent 1-acyl dihydroxyacetone phosphate reductase [Coemansia biformis]|uniref:NADPH-dependent 1-acyl dihydroxyacetone phosphate reductase n=1 Tax=Coemansia biformis TaxID=1286918 RepID=A0A9W7YGN1_9FUNG|nr:NADPH-dependent 1-acyl dihydroxyacetone phosphate reductase [Coemansia biformis]
MAISSGSADPRVVLLTGCSAGGIGHHLALQFAAHGCRVYASARDPAKIQGLEEHGITSIALDVTDDASVKSAVGRVVEEAGRIDILVNNAGVICVGPAVEADMDRVRVLLETNVVGVARVCSAVAPGMIARRQGLVVNIGSVGAFATTPWVGYYGASKAAVHVLSDTMRMELAPFNVRVVVVVPGGIKSNIASNQPEVTLAEDSPYKPAIEAIRARAKYSQTGNSTPTDRFARVVVPQILSPSPRAYIIYGNHSTVTRLLSYIPVCVRDWAYSHRFGTRALAATESVCPATRWAGGICPGWRSNAECGCPVTNPLVWFGVACAVAAVHVYNHPEILVRTAGYLGIRSVDG